jgi:hypothetical protein
MLNHAGRRPGYCVGARLGCASWWSEEEISDEEVALLFLGNAGHYSLKWPRWSEIALRLFSARPRLERAVEKTLSLDESAVVLTGYEESCRSVEKTPGVYYMGAYSESLSTTRWGEIPRRRSERGKGTTVVRDAQRVREALGEDEVAWNAFFTLYDSGKDSTLGEYLTTITTLVGTR